MAHSANNAKPLGASESLHADKTHLALKDWSVSSDTFSSSSRMHTEKKSDARP